VGCAGEKQFKVQLAAGFLTGDAQSNHPFLFMYSEEFKCLVKTSEI
jgi:hypothetical protein